MISNQSIYAIYDNTNVLIQQVNLDHQSFGNLTVAAFNRPGANAVCTDLALYPKTNRLYLACQTDVSQEHHESLWLVELDATTGQVLNTNLQAQDEQHDVVHRLQVQVVPSKNSQGTMSDYVIVYDQGITSAISTKNQWAWVLNGAEQGNLNNLGLVDLPNGAFRILFDMFPINGGLMVTGKNATAKDIIQLGFCTINRTSQVSFDCSTPVKNALFNTTYGYVGILNTGQYIEVNTNPNNTEDDLHICNIDGSFNSSTFIQESDCRTYLSYRTFDNVSISNVEGNQWMVVVKYCHFDSTYAGYSLHQFELRYEDNRYDDSTAPHLVPLGRTLV